MMPFEDLSDDHRSRLLAVASTRHFAPGERIVTQDEKPGRILVLRTGRAQVVKKHQDHDVPVNMIWPGEIFGEVAFLEQSGASASVVATDPVTVDILAPADVHPLLAAEPQLAAAFYRALAVGLAGRLRTSTEHRATMFFSPD